jgi:hypothetical protein
MSARASDLPLPPRELASRVYAMEWSDPDATYLELGAQTKRQVVGLLPDDWSFEASCPPFHAWRTISVPPLGLEHASFDLIYAISVFTISRTTRRRGCSSCIGRSSRTGC